jgi:hypothetical protein
MARSSQKKSQVAPLLGRGLAHVQHLADKALRWGFRKARSVGEKKDKAPKKNDNKYLFALKRAGKGVLRFLGGVGDSFYGKYEDLKAQDHEEETKKKK